MDRELKLYKDDMFPTSSYMRSWEYFCVGEIRTKRFGLVVKGSPVAER